jgi:hypothetical protein
MFRGGTAITNRYRHLDTWTWRFGSIYVQNAYIASLQIIAITLERLTQNTNEPKIEIYSNNLGAIQSIAKPKQQSGQLYLRQIYDALAILRIRHTQVKFQWIPTEQQPPGYQKTKNQIKRQLPDQVLPAIRVKGTTINRYVQSERIILPSHIGKYSKNLDRALPGKHTKKIYDALTKGEAKLLAQIRTGMNRLNYYLYRIGATESKICDCGKTDETIKHYLFWCTKWTEQRQQLFQEQPPTRWGNLSFFLGGKELIDDENWAPSLGAIQSTLKFVKETGRLDTIKDAW